MILLKNANIITMEKNDYQNGYLIIKQGKIQEVGDMAELKANDNEFSEVHDLAGYYVCPGFVDAHCHVGMWEEGIGIEGHDGNEDVDPITPQLRAIDAINPFDKSFKDALAAGVTTVVTGPGSSNVIGGQFVAVKTFGNVIDDMVAKEPVAIKAALGENPKLCNPDKERSPITRMGTAAMLRETLFKAKNYAEDLKNYKKDPKEHDKPEFDFKLESLRPVIDKNLPLKIHAHRADDIATAIRIAKEFGIKITIEHCTEGYMIPDVLRDNKIGVILGPLMVNRSKPELGNFCVDNVKMLLDKGIKTAVMTDHPEVPIQYLPTMAAIVVKSGVDKKEALNLVTKAAAQLCGIDNAVGSLKKGKDADLIVTKGYPIDFYSEVYKVFINGAIVFSA